MKLEMLGLLDESDKNLNLCMTVCIIHFLFPLNYIMEWFFLSKTNRKQQELGLNFLNEACLFVIMCIWFNLYFKLHGKFNPEIRYQEESMTGGQLYITNLISFIEDPSGEKYGPAFPFDIMMAIIAGNTWIKLFLKMRITKTFGPLFKVMINMVI